MTLSAQVEALAAGEIKARELVEDTLRRIEASQPVLNAFRIVCADAAITEADKADRRLAAGERAPLLGVPIAIKDDTDLEGFPTRYGCAGEFPAKTADAELVRRLRAAGAVIVGKTHTSELGQWPFAESPNDFGATRNPWHTGYSPGGSSAGSAAATAAGLVPAAVGSDGAGSVRIPAAWTHLVGIKPQRGRVSTAPYQDLFYGLTCHGPLARTVADAALLLDVISGNHPDDLVRPPGPPEPFTAAARRAPGRLRIALSLRAPYSLARVRVHHEIEAAVTRLAGVLAGLGHDVVEADLNYGLLGGMSFVPRSTVGVHEWAGAVPDPALLDPRTVHTARVGRRLRGPALRAALALERPFARRMRRVFRDVDVVLTPTTAQPPTPIGCYDGLTGWQTDRLMAGACPMAWPWNVLGWPAMSAPAGLTSGGLPIGAQLLGPANSEPRLISLAAQLEAAERWPDRRPPLAERWAGAASGH
jgi:amidase